jgi:DNA polymerase-1
MDMNVKKAQEQGYLKTFKGRIRFFPEFRSPNFATRTFGKRAAMNMPLQGGASDIIKIAMLKVYNALKEGNFKAKLILQVHDELIVDAPEEETEKVKQLLKENMENAVKLSVPLPVNVRAGKNWYEA